MRAVQHPDNPCPDRFPSPGSRTAGAVHTRATTPALTVGDRGHRGRVTTTALIATSDPRLHDEMLRLTAATGVSPLVASRSGEVLNHWAAASVVFVGADLAPELADLAPARRPGVQVVYWGEPDDTVFRPALALGAESVLDLPTAGQFAATMLADLADDFAGPGVLIGVMSGCGGAGATSLTAAVAQVASATDPVMAIDLDVVGPGLDWVLGIEDAAGVRWHDLSTSPGRVSARALRESLPHRGLLSVLTWAPHTLVRPEPAVVREVVTAGARGNRVTVLDLPRGADDTSGDLIARLDLLVLVTRADVCGVASTARMAQMTRTAAGSIRLGLVVRGPSGSEQIADLVGVDLIASMGTQRGLAESVDLGLGPLRGRPGPLARAAVEVLRTAGVR